MVRSFRSFLFLIALLPLGELQAQVSFPISCLPQATSLQVFGEWASKPVEKIYELKTQKFDRIRSSGVVVSSLADHEKGSLELVFSFQDTESISLPFNIYAVMIATSKGQVMWRDLTSSCMDPGIGFYPGQKVSLEPIPLKLEEGETYHLMIWGQM